MSSEEWQMNTDCKFRLFPCKLADADLEDMITMHYFLLGSWPWA